jgi:ribosomal protein S18 acetylase RimI-like enzyme
MLTIKEYKLDFNSYDIPLTYQLNDHNFRKSFALGIFENDSLIFCCRLYHLNKKTRKDLFPDTKIKYEIADIFLYAEYRGKMLDNVKYSKICLDMVDSYLENKKILKLILWTTASNIKAIKRYMDMGFTKEEDLKINEYYQKIAYDTFKINKNELVVYKRI